MGTPTSGPHRSAATADAEAIYLANREVIERVIRFVCRRGGVAADEAEEFASRVHLRFVESKYEALRRFEGRSTLQTYLTIVIQRLFLDYRVERWGRFRPSAMARAAGPAAVRLEQLMLRDGRGFDDALATVAADLRQPVDRDALYALSQRFPVRTRRHFEGEELLESMAADTPDVEALLVQAEREQQFERIHAALARHLDTLPAQDRLLLQLRFEQGLSVADIARTLAIEQKPLYRRVEQLLGRLRAALEAEGLRPDDGGEARANPDGSLTPPLPGKLPPPARLGRMEP
jgi:RNA polymerase sigma factor (sigma-70 family)